MNNLMMKGKVVLLVLMSLITVTACNDDDDDVDLNQMTAQEFVNRATMSNMFEIQTSQPADQNASTDDVKDFAQRMINDHATATVALQTIASSKNMPITTSLTEEKQAIQSRLAGETGVAFDKDYVKVQIDAHNEAISLFEQAADDLDDVELKAYAQATLPVLRQHLQMAQDLKTMTDQL